MRTQTTIHWNLFCSCLQSTEFHKIYIFSGTEAVAYGQDSVSHKIWYRRSCCEGSLKRLDVDYIDVYYQHRVETSLPIEETVSVSKILSPPC